ncbi:hypothetical protein AAHH84_00030 [Candidatus Hodgkinia cicadicola]
MKHSFGLKLVFSFTTLDGACAGEGLSLIALERQPTFWLFFWVSLLV